MKMSTPSNPKTPGTRRSSSNVWEHPCELQEDEERSLVKDLEAKDDDDDDDDDGFEPEEDPLFQDEEEGDANSTVSSVDVQENPSDDKEKQPRNKILWAFGSLLLLLFLILIAILVAWIVDLKKVKPRIEADPLKYVSVDELTVDVTQNSPVLDLKVRILESAFPKHSSLLPLSADCHLRNMDKLPLTATITQLADEDDDAKLYALQVTIPEDAGQDKIEGWADFVWASATSGKTTPWTCFMFFDVSIGNVIPWKHTETKHGMLDLGGGGSSERAVLPPLVTETTTHSYSNSAPTTTTSLAWMVEDGDAKTSLPFYSIQNNSTASPSLSPATMAPSRSPSTSAPSAAANEEQHPWEQQDQAMTIGDALGDITDKPGMVVVRSLSLDRVDLEFRIPKLPSIVFQVVRQIHVKMPPVQIEVAAPQNLYHYTQDHTNHGSRQIVQLESFDITFSHLSQEEEQYANLHITCGKDGATCPWFNPILDTVSETFSPYQQDREKLILVMTIDAEQSFLEHMLGQEHHVVIHRYQVPRFNAYNFNRRRELEEDAPILDCVIAQDPVLGDVLRFFACIDIRAASGLYFNADAQFYSFSMKALADVLWKQEGDVLSLETHARMAVDTDNYNHDNSNQPKLNVTGLASLDLEQSRVDIEVNNTAEWWPFVVVLQGGYSWEEYDDLLRVLLNNATLHVKDEKYAHEATGVKTLNVRDETMSLTIDDPRLQVAVDGAITSPESYQSKAAATWKIEVDDEDISVGESEVLLDDFGEITVQSTSEGKLQGKVHWEYERKFEKLAMKLHEGRMSWNGAAFLDMLGAFTYENRGYKNYPIAMSIEVTERVYDHVLDISGAEASVSSCTADTCYAFRGNANTRLFGRSVFTGTLEIDSLNTFDYPKETMLITVGTRGTIDQSPYVVNLDSELVLNDDETLIKFDWSDLSIDYEGRDILTMSGQSRFVDDDRNNARFAELTAFTGTASEVTFLLDTKCTWDAFAETLTCDMDDMTLGVAGTDVDVQAVGEMKLDLPAQSMSLEVNDDYNTSPQDTNGFDFKISGLVVGDTLTGNLNKMKVVWETEAIMDATGQVTFDGANLVMTMQGDDPISNTTVAVERAALETERNELSDIESMSMVMDPVTATIKSEAWVQGRMATVLDIVKSQVSLSLINNTTKLPIDFDIVISFDSDKGVDDLATLVPYEEPENFGLAFRNESRPSDAVSDATSSSVADGADQEPSIMVYDSPTGAPSSARIPHVLWGIACSISVGVAVVIAGLW